MVRIEDSNSFIAWAVEYGDGDPIIEYDGERVTPTDEFMAQLINHGFKQKVADSIAPIKRDAYADRETWLSARDERIKARAQSMMGGIWNESRGSSMGKASPETLQRAALWGTVAAINMPRATKKARERWVSGVMAGSIEPTKQESALFASMESATNVTE